MRKKIFQKGKNTLLNFLFIACIVSLSACQAGVEVKGTTKAPPGMEKLLIMPFKNMAELYGENRSVRCPISGKVLMIGKVEKGVEHGLTEQLIYLFENRQDFQLIPTGQSIGVMSELLFNNKSGLSERDILIETGRALNADAVIYGYIYQYKERVGTNYSVESPASVAFDIHLISMTDGSLVWSGYFNETQKSLSENLLNLGTFLKRKARWISAHEMAMSGLEEIIKTFPKP